MAGPEPVDAREGSAGLGPLLSRLGGRPMRGISPLDDLIQAQNCCCCLSLRKGLVLLGLVDLARLGVHLAYAFDSIGIYQQTEVPQQSVGPSQPCPPHWPYFSPHSVADSATYPPEVRSQLRLPPW